MSHKILPFVLLFLFLGGCVRNHSNSQIDERTPEEIQQSIEEEEEVIRDPTLLNVSSVQLIEILNHNEEFTYSEKDGVVYLENSSNKYTISFGKKDVNAIYINIDSTEPTKDEELMNELDDALKLIFTELDEEYNYQTIIDFIISGYPYTPHKVVEELYNSNINLICYPYGKGIELDIYPVRQ